MRAMTSNQMMNDETENDIHALAMKWFHRPFSNNRISRWSLALARCQRIALVFIIAAAIAGCVGRRLTKANVDEVAEGMSKKQVESILGPPTNIENKDFLILKKTSYVYRQGSDTVTIVFKDDKVAEKQSTLTN